MTRCSYSGGALAAVSLALSLLAWGASPASAQSVLTFANNAALSVADATTDPDGGLVFGLGGPYPSAVTVSGVTPGAVTGVSARLKGVYHSALADLDFLLVAPNGSSVALLFGGGDPVNGTNVPVSSALDLTFRDDAASFFPTGPGFSVTSGTYRPTVSPDRANDALPAPAPAGPYGTSLLAAATGAANPNGVWRLFVVDTVEGDVGGLANGWELSFQIGGGAVVPEPGTLGLLAVGSVVLLPARRRATPRRRG